MLRVATIHVLTFDPFGLHRRKNMTLVLAPCSRPCEPLLDPKSNLGMNRVRFLV